MTGATQNQKPLRRAAYRLAAWQFALTCGVAAVAAAIGGVAAAQSALMGGGINIVAGLYQALRMFSGQAALQPERFMRAVYTSEAIKIALTVALFIGMRSTRAFQVGSTRSASSRLVTTGSALEITTGALIRSPTASSTPSPGMIRATGTPAATVAPASTAAS